MNDDAINEAMRLSNMGIDPGHSRQFFNKGTKFKGFDAIQQLNFNALGGEHQEVDLSDQEAAYYKRQGYILESV